MRAGESVEDIYRTESRRVLATLIRLLGDFDLAEEALAEAFRAALEQWPKEGVPQNPRAWLVSTGRFKAIDSIRREARFSHLDQEALASEAQVALRLREVCGLTTEAIASYGKAPGALAPGARAAAPCRADRGAEK